MVPEEPTDIDPIDILLVEPNPGDTRLFTESFEEAKLTNTFFSVPDGETALDYVHQEGSYAEHPRPDLILIEPRLPGKSGREVIVELKNDPALEDIPIVVLTSSDTEEEIVRSRDLDADHYTQKPVEPDEFFEFVRSIEDLWFTIVQSADA